MKEATVAEKIYKISWNVVLIFMNTLIRPRESFPFPYDQNYVNELNFLLKSKFFAAIDYFQAVIQSCLDKNMRIHLSQLIDSYRPFHQHICSILTLNVTFDHVQSSNRGYLPCSASGHSRWTGLVKIVTCT